MEPKFNFYRFNGGDSRALEILKPSFFKIASFSASSLSLDIISVINSSSVIFGTHPSFSDALVGVCEVWDLVVDDRSKILCKMVVFLPRHNLS